MGLPSPCQHGAAAHQGAQVPLDEAGQPRLVDEATAASSAEMRLRP
ncbi:hypothetical protein ACFWFU_02990 [Streptomyces sp. NPDC060235]